MAQARFKLCTHWKNLYIVFLNTSPLPPKCINHTVTFVSCLFPKFLFVSFLVAVLFKLVQEMEGLHCVKDSAQFSDHLYCYLMPFLKTSAMRI